MQPKPIRAFTRGLTVLEALNREGSATALVLARQTAIPRGTVYRLLQTLQDAGYVERGIGDERFRLTLRVRGLAHGFEDEHWIAGAARPALVTLTQRLSWPCDILTFRNLRMVIRDTTHPVAPFSIDQNMAGREIPVLLSAAGLAYLAAAPPGEQAQIVGLLSRESETERGRALDTVAIRRLIATTQRQGYGVRQGGRVWPHTGAIALPVRHGPRVLGCVSVIWMSRVVSAQEGVRLCLEPLRETQRSIEAALSSSTLP